MKKAQKQERMMNQQSISFSVVIEGNTAKKASKYMNRLKHKMKKYLSMKGFLVLGLNYFIFETYRSEGGKKGRCFIETVQNDTLKKYKEDDKEDDKACLSLWNCGFLDFYSKGFKEEIAIKVVKDILWFKGKVRKYLTQREFLVLGLTCFICPFYVTEFGSEDLRTLINKMTKDSQEILEKMGSWKE